MKTPFEEQILKDEIYKLSMALAGLDISMKGFQEGIFILLDQQRELLVKEIKPLIRLPTTKEQQSIYDKYISKEYYPHAFGCEKFDDGKCDCGYDSLTSSVTEKKGEE